MSDLYFIRNPETGHIKIGKANDVQVRLAQLQTGCSAKLEILAVFAKAGAFEGRLHQLFHADRLQGEWFLPRNIRRTLDEMGDGDLSEFLNTAEFDTAALSVSQVKQLVREQMRPATEKSKADSDRIRGKLKRAFEEKGLPFLVSILDDPDASPLLKMRATVLIDRYTTPVIETVSLTESQGIAVLAELWAAGRERNDMAS